MFYPYELIMRFWSISTTVRNSERIRSFLKWQYPNHDTNQFNEREGYHIKSFIATLHLISKVNKQCEQQGIDVKGVSKIEFTMFFISLYNFQNIEEIAIKLFKFREKFESIKNEEQQTECRQSYFNTHFYDYESWNNARDYADSVIRCFRLTRYIYITGNEFYIDIEPNYPVGYDNEPTFTAPANKPDIECFYKNFNAICGVTLFTNLTELKNHTVDYD